METNDILSSELSIDQPSLIHLSEAAKWARMLGVLGFIVSGIIIIAALFASTIFTSRLGSEGVFGAGAVAGIALVYLFGAAVNFFISLYLYRFGVKMKTALLNTDQESLTQSFLNLKLVYRIIGIIAIFYIVIFTLVIIFNLMRMR